MGRAGRGAAERDATYSEDKGRPERPRGWETWETAPKATPKDYEGQAQGQPPSPGCKPQLTWASGKGARGPGVGPPAPSRGQAWEGPALQEPDEQGRCRTLAWVTAAGLLLHRGLDRRRAGQTPAQESPRWVSL